MAESFSENWLLQGHGIAPRLRWSFSTEGPLISLAMARETGAVVAGDATGGLYHLDRRGQISALTRGFQALTAVAWSDTGNGGAVSIGDSKLCRLSQTLEVQWSTELPDTILSIAVDPHGHYIAAGLANGSNYVFDANQKRVSRFETFRPLSFLRFLVTEPIILGAAEYGLICCHQLNGEEIWNEKLWSNVGDLSATGDGQTILIAGFNHGIQSFDGDGVNRGSFLVEGTPNHVATTFLPKRLVASTLERQLYWLDTGGEILWAAQPPNDICQVACDPLGNWLICGFESGRILRLDWDESGES